MNFIRETASAFHSESIRLESASNECAALLGAGQHVLQLELGELEIYEERAWEANDSILDPTPSTVSFTFTRSIDPYETFYYFVPKSGPRSPYPASPLLGYINLLY